MNVCAYIVSRERELHSVVLVSMELKQRVNNSRYNDDDAKKYFSVDSTRDKPSTAYEILCIPELLLSHLLTGHRPQSSKTHLLALRCSCLTASR